MFDRRPAAKLIAIDRIAKKAGIPPEFVEPWGRYKAKISLDFLDRIKDRRIGRYILVSAVTPTHLGEGKTVTSIGLSMALNSLGKRSIVCLRQPSMGPVFGTKGGGTGGGRSGVWPAEDINLHFTADIHAVGAANNLLAAFIDNEIYRESDIRIDPASVTWRRALDVNDRVLRHIMVGLRAKKGVYPRESGFDITVASEVMAILALSKDMPDMRRRLARIVIGESKSGEPVTAEDMHAAGAMAALLKDAIKPNIVQTTEHTPCFIHAGPFANIAHGNNSIIADEIALKIADYVVTESGFGADLGAEKFFDIKCRTSGFMPDAAVIVCSVRALKMHSGRYNVHGGQLDEAIYKRDADAARSGCANLRKQIKNIAMFGMPAVVAINRFETDGDDEIQAVQKEALACGAADAVVSTAYADGSKGGLKLGRAVIKAAESGTVDFKFLYPLDMSIKEKISAISKNMYGAKSVSYSTEADSKIARYERRGWGRLPVCIAKTHLSLSADPDAKGVPEDFDLPVRDIDAKIGAGFILAICGAIQTMPGLPERPIGKKIDIDDKGGIIGLA